MVKLNRDPQFLRIKSRLYTAEGIERTQDIFTASEEGIVRINVSFELLWRNICVSEELTPIAYDIYGLGANSVSEPDTAGAKNYPFAQRYILRSGNFRDRCFLFQNSLGGFDTIIASGLSTLLPEGEVDTFINQGPRSGIKQRLHINLAAKHRLHQFEQHSPAMAGVSALQQSLPIRRRGVETNNRHGVRSQTQRGRPKQLHLQIPFVRKR